MNDIRLFRDSHGEWLTDRNLKDKLLDIGAADCDILFIHSELSFGLPNPDIKHKQLLEAIVNVLRSLGVRTVCMPTFTFSYCNGKVYDPAKSKSRMGVLNEYFRKQEGVVRSADPLMSVAVMGDDKDLALGISNHSIGDNSTYDKLRHRDGVKFLFLGTKIGYCFTYMHYMEWLYGVPYRYERRFKGKSVVNGVEVENEFDLFVRHNGVLPNDNSYVYEQSMYDHGQAKIVDFGDSTISIVGEQEASEAYKECLMRDLSYFVEYKGGAFFPDKTFRLESEMVAL